MTLLISLFHFRFFSLAIYQSLLFAYRYLVFLFFQYDILSIVVIIFFLLLNNLLQCSMVRLQVTQVNTLLEDTASQFQAKTKISSAS